MKTQLIATILLAAFAVQAKEVTDATLFSSKKEVQEEVGPEQVIVRRALPDLMVAEQTGVVSAKAQEAMSILAKNPANQGKTLKQIILETYSK